jgi:hypothetical protein
MDFELSVNNNIDKNFNLQSVMSNEFNTQKEIYKKFNLNGIRALLLNYILLFK